MFPAADGVEVSSEHIGNLSSVLHWFFRVGQELSTGDSRVYRFAGQNAAAANQNGHTRKPSAGWIGLIMQQYPLRQDSRQLAQYGVC